MRRILVVHNRYRQRGGEDEVVDSEIDLLRRRGHDVELLAPDNASIESGSKLALARHLVWSTSTTTAIERLFAQFRPDIVHVHNTLPLISPSVYWAAARHGRPVVQTLHNFRLACPQAMLLRDGKVCEDCVGRVPWRAAARSCYRGSAVESAAVAGMLVIHRALGTYDRKVTRYIALNRFCRDKFVAAGLRPGRISIKPNFVDVPEAPPGEGRSGTLFVGRLSPEKGVSVLLRALERLPGQSADIAGTGPEEAVVRAHPSARALGPLTRDEVLKAMRRAGWLVMPSLWYETFGMVALEAFACGLPVIASRLGAMEELVRHGDTGLLFEPGSAESLAQTLAWAARHPVEMAAMGRRARETYLARFTPERNYLALMAIYEQALRETVPSPFAHGTARSVHP
jgi:glycosyltransferase involved in cell wall biosynthesis